MCLKYNLFIFIIVILIMPGYASNLKNNTKAKYAVAKMPTPVFHTSDLNSIFGGKDGITLKLSDYGEIDELEFIALTGSVFTIEKVLKNDKNTIYKVNTKEYFYPTDEGYYIDSRFVITSNIKQDERHRILPSKKIILKILRNTEGAIYTWGGNFCQGIPELLKFYPPAEEIDAELKKQWILSGVDCSGLLYEAVNGCIPRNTSSLVTFGSPVQIKNLTADEIIKKILPLDIIVWKGHMMIVIDRGEIIESSPSNGGVKIFPAEIRLEALIKDRSPVNNYDENSKEKQFVIRRWIKY